MRKVKRILVVEDERDIAEFLTHYLKREGYSPSVVYDGRTALQRAESDPPDLVILDILLPGMDGLEVCRRLRGSKHTAGIPIIMLTAKGEEADRVVGLEMGADDYITKPFSLRELVARIKSLFRRLDAGQSQAKVYHYGPLFLDRGSFEAREGDREVTLTAKEFGLLEAFLQAPGRVLTRDFLLQTVWGYDYYGSTRTVDVHVRHLREKIPLLSKAIVTIKNVGYKLREIP
jgi:DNA-binding response OmpR family regulator